MATKHEINVDNIHTLLLLQISRSKTTSVRVVCFTKDEELCFCGTELTLRVRMNFFYASFHAENSQTKMASGRVVLDRDALFQAANILLQ